MSAAEDIAPFDDAEQKRRADTFGMFVFLASEIMLFGGLFAALAAYRVLYPAAANAASQRLDMWLGAANTGVLLTSSLFVALASVAARDGKPRASAWRLSLAAALGAAFLVVKGVEYHGDFIKGVAPGVVFPNHQETLFVSLYFVSTILHAVHVTIGVVSLAWAGIGVATKRLAVPERAETVELVGLYWHLVDVIWVFLFPLLYLARA